MRAIPLAPHLGMRAPLPRLLLLLVFEASALEQDALIGHAGDEDVEGVCLMQQNLKSLEDRPRLLHAEPPILREGILREGILRERPAKLAGLQLASQAGEGSAVGLHLVGQGPHLPAVVLVKAAITISAVMALLTLVGWANPRLAAVARAVRCAGYYIIASSAMIESNKWLMAPGRFPHPFSLTFNHMLSGTILSNLLRKVCPSAFPALQNLEVTPRFCAKFLGLGGPFMLSIVCGNAAYKYLSVSFLQIMKQTNIITIYVFSLLAGLESLRFCNVTLLVVVLAGVVMGIEGAMRFELKGFLLQIVSSWTEAVKIVLQSFLMSGQAKLDPLTLFLFMAPACFLANLLPWAIVEGHQFSTILSDFLGIWQVALGNMVLAFVLNVVVAQCIREISPVGFMLCGVVKDTCIILTSTVFLGESLTQQQHFGFSVALSGVFMYSVYKQNLDCFEQDSFYLGFRNLHNKLVKGQLAVAKESAPVDLRR